ncbi:MAG: hypothetical protein U9O54_01185, partial [Chloroflexota bacterium]|nr:hypothetical protein [Chloroflexota bacterium]
MRPHRNADQPFWRVVVTVNWGRVPNVEKPAAFGLDCYAAMTWRMPEEWYQPHFRCERQADGWEVEPGFAVNIIIEYKIRLMGDVAADIGQVCPVAGASHKGRVLEAMDMDFGVRKIWQAA